MKRYILFGLTLLMAFPVSSLAQDDFDDEETGMTVKKIVRKQKKYETRVIKGRVIDAATGKPLSGALVKATGLNGYSALTDDDGCYTANVPLFVSSIDVTMPDYNPVMVGLNDGTDQKTAQLLKNVFNSEYRGGVNVLGNNTATSFQYSNSINIKEEVQKQLGAYAYTTTRNGMPGIGSTMFIQGLNSLNANAQPLVVVDGVVQEQQYDAGLLHDGFYNDILTTLNPADVASVTVMRNGTALYGARAANGVLLINTRRNSSMATRITASVSGGVSLEPKYIDMMSANQYRNYASELLKGTGTRIKDFKFLNADPQYYYYNQYHNNTDWKKEVYQTAFTQNYGINIDGGDEVAKYNISVGYTNAQSNLQFNDMDRLNIRFNTDITLIDPLTVRFDASFSNITRNIRDDGAPSQYDEGTPTSPAFLAYVKAPFLSPYSYGHGVLSKTYLDITDESYLTEGLAAYPKYNWKLGNPWAMNKYSEGEHKNHFENSIFNIAVTPKWEFNQHLFLSEHFSYSLVNTSEKYYLSDNGTPSYYVSSVYANRNNQVQSLASKQNSIQSDTRLAWDNRYNGHLISVFGGVRLNFETFSRNSQLGYDTGTDKTPFMSGSLKNAQTEGVDDSWRTMDVYAQANYNYLGRYYLQGNLTGTGSSRFGFDAKGGLSLFGVAWGIFPGLQASWVMSNEKWFSNVPGIDYLRINAGYEITGNDDISNNASRSYFRSQLYLHQLAGLSFDGIGNTEIKWETTRRFNAGVEANFLSNRLHARFNYFYGVTSDLLSLQTLGFLSGIEANWSNSGKLSNEGFDVTVDGKIIATKDWSWELGASVGHYVNEIKELAGGVNAMNTDIYNATIRTEVGRAANVFYGYQTNGVFATSKQAEEAGLYVLAANGVDKNYFGAGDMIFADNNPYNAKGEYAPGQIDEADRVVIGDPNPDIYGNIFTALQWKRLRLDANFTYSLGGDVYNYMRSQLEGGSRFMNQTTAMARRWQVEGQVTDMPKITFQDPMQNSRFSDRWIEDGSYLKLKSVTLSYQLPINSTFIQGLQFWLQGNNLFTLSHYLGSDPEFALTNAVLGQGIDYGRIGSSRSIVAGIKINL